MPFFTEQKDILELQFEKPNVNFLVDEDSEAVRLHELIKKLDFSEFYKRYSDKGAVAYRPEVLFAVIILGILEGVLSSRAIEKKCRRDVYFIYFTEYRKPDHATIARFLQKFRKEISELLPQLIAIAMEHKISAFTSLAIDGSKFQSKSSKKHSMRMRNLVAEEKILSRKLEKLMNILRENDKKENRDEKSYKRWEAEQERLEQRRKKISESKAELEKRQLTIRDKEESINHQINLAEPDARMMNEIKANGYNVQLTVDTHSELIVNATVETDRADFHQFSKQHQNSEAILGEDTTREYIADAGYCSSETLDYVSENEINAYINSRDIDSIPSVDEFLERDKRISIDYFVYSNENNEYICPNNQSLKEVKPKIYESASCEGCKIRHLCIKGRASKRRIKRTTFAEEIEIMKQKLKANPDKMNKRKVVERKFGDIKWNLGFRRFTRKDIEGASLEIMMVVLALNMKKLMQLLLLFLRQLLYTPRPNKQPLFDN